MKKILLIMALVLLVSAAYSQSKDLVVHPYYMSKGFGAEVGRWPSADGKFGFFGGVAFANNQSSSDKDMIFYGRGQYRSSKYVHVVASIGIADLNKLYSGIGLRLAYPFLIKKFPVSVLLQPELTSLGYKTSAGAIFVLR